MGVNGRLQPLPTLYANRGALVVSIHRAWCIVGGGGPRVCVVPARV